MVGMRLTLILGITGMLALVQGCSGLSETSSQPPSPGEQTPQAEGADEGAESPADEAPPGADPAGSQTSAETTPPTPPEKSKMTFFVTSTGTGADGGNLGGLAGADKKCQDLATAVGAGDHTWRAYLSVQGTNARDRIGTGPWLNQQGKVIASTLDQLHDYLFIPSNADLLDEKGAVVPADRRMILTGSNHDGTAAAQTCQDWTSNANNQRGRVGDVASDTSNILGARWNDAVSSYGCSQQAMNQNKGEGRLYCFAID
jgi:hypothetical protein